MTKFTFPSKFAIFFGLLHLCGIYFAPSAQPFVFKKVVDTSTPRPDGIGNFDFNAFLVCSAIGNGRVIFDSRIPVESYGPVSESIWSATVTGQDFRKLVDRSTAVPGGSGTFFELNTFQSPVLRDGTVVFVGRDSNFAVPFGTTNQGIYSVPVTGGAVNDVVSYTSTVPGDSVKFSGFESGCCGRSGQVSFDGSNVLFRGNYPGHGGVYRAGVDGSGLTTLADDLHPQHPLDVFPVSNFYNPAVDNGMAIFQGANVFANKGFYSTSSLSTPIPVLSEFETLSLVLPGATLPNDDTYIDGYSLQIKDSSVAFSALDYSSSLHGLYTMAAGGGALTKIFDTNTPPPGLGAVSINSFKGHAVSEGNILFYVLDDSPGHFDSVLYIAPVGGGVPTRVIGTGDVLDGLTVKGVGVICPDSMTQSEIAFTVYFNFGSPIDQAIYAAAPLSHTADLTVAAVKTGLTGPANQFGLTVTVNNAGFFNARSVELNIELPVGVTLVSSSQSSTSNGSTVKVSLGDIGSSSSKAVDLVIQGDGTVKSVPLSAASNTLESNSANNATSIQTDVSPASKTPADIARALLQQILDLYPNASKKLPAKPAKSLAAKKKATINAKRAVILGARSAMKAAAAELQAMADSPSLSEVQSELGLYTSANIKALKKNIKVGSSAKTASNVSKKSWKTVKKLAQSILGS